MRYLERLYAAPPWRIGIGLAVLVNSIVLGMITETPEGSEAAGWLSFIDEGLLALLVADVVLCIAVKRRRVLRNGWDLFDISVTLISIIPNVGVLSSFRVLRVTRVLRLVSFVPYGRAMVDALLGALRNMITALLMLGVVFYSFVIVMTNLFRTVDPAHYATLSRAAAHLYTVMVTLGSSLETEVPLHAMPWALPIYAVFIVIASFGLLNMFIAVLVAALKEQLEAEMEREERARFDRLERKLDTLVAAIETIRRARPPVSP